MTKIEAIIQPSKFDYVKQALIDIGIDGRPLPRCAGMAGKKAIPTRITDTNTVSTYCRR